MDPDWDFQGEWIEVGPQTLKQQGFIENPKVLIECNKHNYLNQYLINYLPSIRFCGLAIFLIWVYY